MSSRRSSAGRDDGPSAKRQKVYRACLGCVNSKTRCEDVVPAQGCLRCRTKQKECSLIESGAALRGESSERAVVEAEWENRLDATEEGWRTLAKRVDRLEQGLYALGNAPSSSTQATQPATPSTMSLHRPVATSELFSTLNWNTIVMSETIFNMSDTDSYPDPVARGLMTMEQMELSFHL